jgi:hypothetical protein
VKYPPIVSQVRAIFFRQSRPISHINNKNQMVVWGGNAYITKEDVEA